MFSLVDLDFSAKLFKLVGKISVELIYPTPKLVIEQISLTQSMIDLKFQFNVDTFEALVRYFYTNCCEISLENVQSFKALAKHCRSPKLIDLIQIKQKEIDEWSSFKVSLNLRNRTVRS